MGTMQTLKRLIWKEFREDWLVVLILLALPVIVFLPAARVKWQWMEMFIFLTTLAVPFTVALWGGHKASVNTSRQDFVKTHLSTGQVYTLLISFFLPAVVFGLVGWWFGRLVGIVATDRPHYAIVWAVYLPATYMLGYFLSLVTSIWFAAIVGVLWSVQGFALAAYTAVGSEIGTFSLWVGTGAAVGMLFYSLSDRRISPRFGKAASLFLAILIFAHLGSKYGELNFGPWVGVAVGVLILFLILQGDSSRLGQGASLLMVLLIIASSFYIRPWIENLNRVSKAVYYTPDWVGKSGDQRGVVVKGNWKHQMELSFFDDLYGPSDRENPKYTITLKQPVRILGVMERRYVYVAQQLPDEQRLRILVWDPLSRTNTLRTAASVPAGQGTLIWRNLYHTTSDPAWDWNGSVKDARHAYLSPDGRYALLITLSRIGVGADIWLIDLKRNKGRIVLANTDPATEQVVWLADTVMLSGSGNNVAIDLRKMTAQFINLPAAKGR